MVGILPTLLSKTFFTALVAGKENVTDNDFPKGFWIMSALTKT